MSATQQDVQPEWARYVAGVVAELRPTAGFTGVVRSDLPAGVGPVVERRPRGGVRSGAGRRRRVTRSPWPACVRPPSTPPAASRPGCSTSWRRSAASTAADCTSTAARSRSFPCRCRRRTSPVARRVGGRPFARRVRVRRPRRRARRRRDASIGPLRDASIGSLDSIDDPTIRARARHVIFENARVDDFAAAIAGGDLNGAGQLMSESHGSLSETVRLLHAADRRVVPDVVRHRRACTERG